MSITPGILEATASLSQPSKKRSHRFYVALLIPIIFLAEIVSMVLIYFIDVQNYLLLSFLDGVLMMVLVLPGLYYLQLKPLLSQIEERTRAESAVKENEKLLNQVLELLPVGIWIADQSGNIIRSNQAGREIWAGARYVGIDQYGEYKGWWAKTGKRLEPEEWAVARAVNRGVSSLDEEIEIECFDGTRKIIINSAVPLLDDNNRIKGAIAINRDVTQRIQTERTLTRTNELLERFFLSIDILIAYMDRDFRFIRVNEAYAKSAGHPVEFFPGKNHFDLYPQDENVGIFQRVVDTGEPFSVLEKPFEYAEYPELGVTYWNWSLQPVKDAGGIVEGLVLSLLDVTERKRAELKLGRQNEELRALSDAEHSQRELAETLVQASITLSTSLDLDQVLHSYLELIRKIIPYQGAGILLAEKDGLRLAGLLGFEDHLESPPLIQKLSTLDQYPSMRKVFTSGQPIFAANVDEYPDQYRTPGLEWIRAVIAVPLTIDGKVTGIISLLSDRDGAFSQSDVDRLVAFAAPAALALRNARSYQAEMDARQAAESLRASAQALTQSLDLTQVVNTLLDHLQDIVNSDTASLTLLEDETRPAVRIARGYNRWIDKENIPSVSIESVLDSLSRNLLEKRKPMSIENLGAAAAQLDIPDSVPVNRWLVVPIIVKEKIIGLVEMGKVGAGTFTQENYRWAEALVGQAAIAIQNASLFEQVRSSSDRLQSLARRLVEVQESERFAIARELHDEAGQSLSSLKISLGRLEQDPDFPASLSGRVQELKSMADSVLDDLHRLAVDLRPVVLDQLGLIAALEQIARKFNSPQLAVRFKSLCPASERFTPAIETSLYRITQEALTNSVRHGHATTIGILVEHSAGKLHLFVEDDGIGFQPDEASQGVQLGLVGMRERAEMLGGTLTIESAPGSGTSIIVEVPDVYPNPDRG